MTRIKVYPAPWVRWLVLAIFIPVWGLITYGTFFEIGEEPIPIFMWVFITIILLVVVIGMFFAGGRRLPSHVIEVDDDDLRKLFGKDK